MPRKNKEYISLDEIKFILKQDGVEIRPSYKHEDYMFTSFTMPYPLKNKLDRIAKKYELSRSKVVQLLLSSINEYDFFESLKGFKNE